MLGNLFGSDANEIFKFLLGKHVRKNYTLPIAQILAVSFVLCMKLMFYKKFKSMKKVSGFSDKIANVSSQRQKTLSVVNKCLFFYHCILHNLSFAIVYHEFKRSRACVI